MDAYAGKISSKVTATLDQTRDKNFSEIIDQFMSPVVKMMRWLSLILIFLTVVLVVAGGTDIALVATFSPAIVTYLITCGLLFLAVCTFRYAFRVRPIIGRRDEIEAALKGLETLNKDGMRVAAEFIPRLQKGRPIMRYRALRELVAMASEHPLVTNARDLQRDLFGPLSQFAIYGAIASAVVTFAFVPLAIAAIAS